jgi:hypothetical protein
LGKAHLSSEDGKFLEEILQKTSTDD